jgi:mevalonate kinase
MTEVNSMRGARACGKLILLGEHAVVHGVAALACGIDRGLSATLHAARGGRSSLTLLAERRTLEDGDALAHAFAALLEAGSGPPGAACDVVVTGDLPPGMNLGFSAAAAVAVARCFEEGAGRAYDEAVRARADAWERVFHGNPSGIDVAAAMRGGFVRYRRGEAIRRLRAVRPLRLCVGLSGAKPGPTRAMVDRVTAQKERDPSAFTDALQRIAALVDEATVALEEGDVVALGAAMNANHERLAAWSLSTERLDALCRAARHAGALGAKLTGAGGGGAMVALAGAADDAEAQRRATRILEAFRREGTDGFEVVVSGDQD